MHAQANATPTGTGDPLSALRDATRSLHANIEDQPLVRPLVSGTGLDLRTYRGLLLAFHGWYRALEGGGFLERADQLSEGSAYRYRRRAPLLAADLDDLGLDPRTSPLAEPGLPSMHSTPQVLGVLYVIEGATRGGRTAAMRITRVLGLHAGLGARFFHLDTADEQSWPAYLALLRSTSSSSTESLLDSARSTFLSLHRHLDHAAQVPGRQ